MNPLNDHMLDILLKKSGEKAQGHINDIQKAIDIMCDDDDDTCRMVTINAEVLYAVLMETQILREVINGGLTIVRTFIADSALSMPIPKRVQKTIKDYSGAIENCTPHTDKLTKEILPTLEENIFNG